MSPHPGAEVEERAEAAGYRLARRSLRGQLVWWWQITADPDDTRQPSRAGSSGVRPSPTWRPCSTASRCAVSSEARCLITASGTGPPPTLLQHRSHDGDDAEFFVQRLD